MELHFHPPDEDRPGPSFPTLPIVTPDAPRRSQSDKYGGLFYFGAIGLVVITALVAWFGYGVWSMRAVWSNVYVLHDKKRTDAERIQAAYALSRDRRVNQRQLWDMCLRRPLPGLARYVLAEALTAEAASADPRAYALAVAHSRDWPDWLRLLLTRSIALAAIERVHFPTEALEALHQHDDPTIRLWAAFALACDQATGEASRVELDRACKRATKVQELACLLAAAAGKTRGSAEQLALVDRATVWLRTHHPESARLWKGWSEEHGRLEPAPASELH